MNAFCTLLCKEHHRYLCLNVIFLVFSEISCDISYMSVAREAHSKTGEFPPSLYLQPALLFFLAKSHWLPRVADSLQKNDFTFLTNHTFFSSAITKFTCQTPFNLLAMVLTPKTCCSIVVVFFLFLISYHYCYTVFDLNVELKYIKALILHLQQNFFLFILKANIFCMVNNVNSISATKIPSFEFTAGYKLPKGIS